MTRSMLVLAILLVACGQEAPPKERPLRMVRYQTIGAAAGPTQSTYAGVAASTEQSRLSFRASGAVSTVDVDVGDTVRKGQVLATLDTSDLSLALAEAGSQVQQARAQNQLAQAEYQRTRALFEARGASRGELDAARAEAQAAQTALSAAQISAARARNEVGYGSLVAPTAGSISEVRIEAGENVNAGETVVVLEAGDGLQARVGVPARQISRIQEGTSVAVSFTALGASQDGVVDEIGVAAEGGSYPVTVRLAEVPEGARPGMAVEARFELAEDDAAADAPLRVPVTSAGSDAEGDFVYVIESLEDGVGTLRHRTVVFGDIGDAGIVVTEGLADGDLVITAGVSRAADGMKVRVPADESPDGSGDDAPEAPSDDPPEGTTP